MISRFVREILLQIRHPEFQGINTRQNERGRITAKDLNKEGSKEEKDLNIKTHSKIKCK